MPGWIILGVTVSFVVYLLALHRRLTTPNPSALTYRGPPISSDDLVKVTLPRPHDIAEAIKAHGPVTGKAYVVVGGSGLVGQYIVRTLLARGETLVRIIDVVEPKVAGNSDANAVDSLSRAEFIQADVTDYQSIADAISRPFGNTGRTAEAVIHTVALIRNFERLEYLKDLSYQVNVEGTKNVLRASQDLGTVGSFVYTSSAGIFAPPSNFLRLGVLGSRGRAVFGDDAPEDIRASDGVKNIRTGVLRPGMAIMGPESIFISMILKNTGVNPTWGGKHMNSMVNAWDVGRAHVQLSDALFERPEDVAGQSFAITGEAAIYPLSEVLKMMQPTRSKVPANFGANDVFSLVFVEAILLGRYLVLKMVTNITGGQLAPVPKWAVETKLQYIQPAMWDLSLMDIIIDDSRARKILGSKLVGLASPSRARRSYWPRGQPAKSKYFWATAHKHNTRHPRGLFFSLFEPYWQSSIGPNATVPDQLAMLLNSERTLAIRGFLLATHIAVAGARRWTVNNDCPFTIWPAIYTSNTSAVTLSGVETGWEAPPNSSRSFVVPEGWSGAYIWGRRDCNFSSGNSPADTNTTIGGCVSGGCPGGLYCTGLGSPPTTHAEWTLAPGDGSGADYYDISIVQGFNLPMSVVPSAVECGIAECAVDLNAGCPDPLRGPFAPNTNNTVPIGCKSACTANLDGNPDNSAACCTGQFAEPGACPASGVPFYDYFKNACRFTYAYSSNTTTQSGGHIATSGTITGIPSMTPAVTSTLTSSRSLGTSLIPSNANSASTLPVMQIGLMLGLVTSIWGSAL
ncbi:thaumatin-like protein [Rhizoctonia solani]|uniref:Thaumatin-like protein n=1 Tax=Rhizoctonia solani TaxID=456999 RepID=A0A8H7IBK4_9AGAM|nr:thaumatin-like protein [Rhizoctonia solani]